MISPEAFAAGWEMICRRWRRADAQGRLAVDHLEADDYHRFLSPLMGDEEFTAACRAVWATREFFPRPCDFLLVAAGGEWGLVLRCLDARRGKTAWHEEWRALSERGRGACTALGGMDALLAAFDRDPVRLRQAWEREYEVQAQVQALAAPVSQKRLGAGIRKISGGA